MPSRRAVLAAAAAAALTAACGEDQSDRHAAPAQPTSSGSPTTGTTEATSPPPAHSGSTSARGEAVEIRHGSRTRQQVALTFHGSGDPSLAQRLLALLERHQVHGTVLAVGTWLQANPRMAGRVTDAGHELGNHTLHHYPMRSLASTAAYDEVEGCARVLHRLTGSQGSWFRASGTQATTTRIRRAAARAGYDRCVSYDVDGLDWQDPSAGTVTDAVLAHARPGSIISLHLGHPVTISALPTVLDGLRHAKLAPVTLTELLA